MSEQLGTLLLTVIFFLIGVVVTRWIFGITKIINLLQAQRDLLALMAKKQGIDETTVDNIVKNSNK